MVDKQVEPDGELLLLDSNAATKPAFKRTWLANIVSALYRRVRGEKTDDGISVEDLETEELNDDSSGTDAPGSGAVTPNSDNMKGHVATTNAGGRRRKNASSRRKGGRRDASSS